MWGLVIAMDVQLMPVGIVFLVVLVEKENYEIVCVRLCYHWME